MDGGARGRHYEAGVVALRVVVPRPAEQAAVPEHRLGFEHAPLAQHSVRPHIAEQCQHIVQPHRRRPAASANPVSPVDRKDERQRPHEVGRDPQKVAALPVGLQHQPEIAGLEIAKAAVNQPAGARAGARPEVVLLHQHRTQAAHGRVAGHAGARDPATDDQDIRGLRAELRQCRSLRGTPSVPAPRAPRPSTWFLWHAHRLGPGTRVLDLACGEGRHSLAAAAHGRQVVASTGTNRGSPGRGSWPSGRGFRRLAHRGSRGSVA